jgi:hypothetical protein
MEPTQEETRVLIDFSSPGVLRHWRTIADTVMGGVSEGTISNGSAGFVRFHGIVSLDNNGGFVSVRTPPMPFDLVGYEGISLRVRGDGKTYHLRLRTEDAFDGVAYRARFATLPDEWTTVRLPFSDFRPTYRGNELPEAPPLDPAGVRQLGLMITDRQEGPFDLHLASIKAFRAARTNPAD